jgi:hypothetical protein
LRCMTCAVPGPSGSWSCRHAPTHSHGEALGSVCGLDFGGLVTSGLGTGAPGGGAVPVDRTHAVLCHAAGPSMPSCVFWCHATFVP